jgi:hypothetical protein
MGISAAPYTPESIMIDVPSFPLTPGEHQLNVAVCILPRIGGRICDEVHRAAEFSVIAADLLDTVHRFGAKDGLSLVSRDWELRSSAPDRAPGDAAQPR